MLKAFHLTSTSQFAEKPTFQCNLALRTMKDYDTTLEDRKELKEKFYLIKINIDNQANPKTFVELKINFLIFN